MAVVGLGPVGAVLCRTARGARNRCHGDRAGRRAVPFPGRSPRTTRSFAPSCGCRVWRIRCAFSSRPAGRGSRRVRGGCSRPSTSGAPLGVAGCRSFISRRLSGRCGRPLVSARGYGCGTVRPSSNCDDDDGRGWLDARRRHAVTATWVVGCDGAASTCAGCGRSRTRSHVQRTLARDRHRHSATAEPSALLHLRARSASSGRQHAAARRPPVRIHGAAGGGPGGDAAPDQVERWLEPYLGRYSRPIGRGSRSCARRVHLPRAHRCAMA